MKRNASICKWQIRLHLIKPSFADSHHHLQSTSIYIRLKWRSFHLMQRKWYEENNHYARWIDVSYLKSHYKGITEGVISTRLVFTGEDSGGSSDIFSERKSSVGEAVTSIQCDSASLMIHHRKISGCLILLHCTLLSTVFPLSVTHTVGCLTLVYYQALKHFCVKHCLMNCYLLD